MARKTVAQLREAEVDKLVHFKTDDPTEEDYAEARTVMNSFYRLCALAEKNLYLANDERTCNTKYTHDSEAKEQRWLERLNKKFMETYGLCLYYAGYAPSIGTRINSAGGMSEKITRWFYR